MAHFESAPQVVWPETTQGEQLVPVNVFDTFHDLVLVAPMPGLEPDNIEVTLAGKILTIRGDLRGPGQERRRYSRHEWTYGPYFRRLELPYAVDAEHANASYNNGVLTLAMPKLAASQPQQIAVQSISMRQVGTTEGHRRGHAGHHTCIDVEHLPSNRTVGDVGT